MKGLTEPKVLPIVDEQQFTCPEALYWKTGDVVLIGKGNYAFWFDVVSVKGSTATLLYNDERRPR